MTALAFGRTCEVRHPKSTLICTINYDGAVFRIVQASTILLFLILHALRSDKLEVRSSLVLDVGCACTLDNRLTKLAF